MGMSGPLQLLVIRLSVVEAEEQHAAALGGIGVYLPGIFAAALAQEHVRRTEQIGLVLVEAHAAEFLGEVKGTAFMACCVTSPVKYLRSAAIVSLSARIAAT